jgi:hypothetical protein
VCGDAPAIGARLRLVAFLRFCIAFVLAVSDRGGERQNKSTKTKNQPKTTTKTKTKQSQKLTGAAMMASEAVRKVGFTGSTAVGKLLMAQAAAVRLLFGFVWCCFRVAYGLAFLLLQGSKRRPKTQSSPKQTPQNQPNNPITDRQARVFRVRRQRALDRVRGRRLGFGREGGGRFSLTQQRADVHLREPRLRAQQGFVIFVVFVVFFLLRFFGCAVFFGMRVLGVCYVLLFALHTTLRI